MFRKTGFRPRAESRAMHYIAAAVGLVSGYYIFQPYFLMKQQQAIGSTNNNSNTSSNGNSTGSSSGGGGNNK